MLGIYAPTRFNKMNKKLSYHTMFGNLLPVFLCIDHSDTECLDKNFIYFIDQYDASYLTNLGVIKIKSSDLSCALESCRNNRPSTGISPNLGTLFAPSFWLVR